MHHLMLICGIWSGKSHSETRGRQAIGFSLWKVLYNARLLIGSQLRTLLRGQFPFCVFEIKGLVRTFVWKLFAPRYLKGMCQEGTTGSPKYPCQDGIVFTGVNRDQRGVHDTVVRIGFSSQYWLGDFDSVLFTEYYELNWMFFHGRKKKNAKLCIFVCVVFIYTDDLYINK